MLSVTTATGATPGPALVVLLSGPNLICWGAGTEVYGQQTLGRSVAAASEEAERSAWSSSTTRANHEGELVGFVHEARGTATA